MKLIVNTMVFEIPELRFTPSGMTLQHS